MPGLPKPTISFTQFQFVVRRWSFVVRQAFHSDRNLLPITYKRQPRKPLGLWPTTNDARPTTASLFLFLLLGFLGRSFCAFLFLLLALLDAFRLGRSCRRFACHRVSRRNFFFLHGDDVRDWLIRIGKKLDLGIYRQVRHAQHHAEYQFGDVQFNRIGNVAGQALDFDFAPDLLQDATLRLHARGLADEGNGHVDLEFLVHRDSLQVNVRQRALDRLVLPVHDHGLGALTIHRKVKHRVVPGSRMQNARHLPRINTDRDRLLARAINHGRDLALTSHPAGIIFGAGSTRLGFEYALFGCRCSHNFDSYKNSLLTDISS